MVMQLKTFWSVVGGTLGSATANQLSDENADAHCEVVHIEYKSNVRLCWFWLSWCKCPSVGIVFSVRLGVCDVELYGDM